MKNKRVFRVLVITVVLLCSIFALLLYLRPFLGECSALSQLPLFGSELPVRNVGQIRYVAERGGRRVLARVNSTSHEFDKLVDELKLEAVRYGKGFNAPPDFMAVDKEFRPKGTRVWVGYGAIRDKGRTSIRIYFEPTDNDGAKGVLYIHIS